MTREAFLGWAAQSQSAQDVKNTKRDKSIAPNTERMMVTFMAWKSASEFKIISTEKDERNATSTALMSYYDVGVIVKCSGSRDVQRPLRHQYGVNTKLGPDGCQPEIVELTVNHESLLQTQCSHVLELCR